MDGGVTWSENVRLSDYFNSHLGWPNQNKMGDYFDMVSDSSGASLAWAATFNGEQDVYYSYIADTTIVPVELVSFSAYVAANVVNLEWNTATELNNQGFEIERSSDRINWRTIGFKEGKGTTSEPQQYYYSDLLSGIESSKLYYRLKQIDFNGSFEYTDVVDVEIAPLTFELSQNYPNPFNPSTSISYQLPVKSFVKLEVYDILGNKVATLINEEKPAGSFEVDFDGTSSQSGVYFYRLQAVQTGRQAGDFIKTKKMVVLK
jgi:hypothetical protein